MTTTTTYAAVTSHESFTFDGSDCAVVVHSDPACGFIAEGVARPSWWVDDETVEFVECRFCIGGNQFRPFGRQSTAPMDTEVNNTPPRRKHGTPDPDAPRVSDDDRIARLIAFAESLGRKCEVSDVTDQVRRDVQVWLGRYHGDNEFLAQMRTQRSRLSAPMVKGVVNCVLRAEREATQPATESGEQPARWTKFNDEWVVVVAHDARSGDTVTIAKRDGSTSRGVLITNVGVVGGNNAWTVKQADTAPASTTFTFADVPEGHYAIPSTGDNDLVFYRVDHNTEGDYAGTFSAKMIVGGHPDMWVKRNTIPGILVRIVEYGVAESAKLYGTELGQCCRCNRHLTDEVSRELGIGPECRKKGI